MIKQKTPSQAEKIPSEKALALSIGGFSGHVPICRQSCSIWFGRFSGFGGRKTRLGGAVSNKVASLAARIAAIDTVSCSRKSRQRLR